MKTRNRQQVLLSSEEELLDLYQIAVVCNRNLVSRPHALFTLPKRHADGLHTGFQLQAPLRGACN